MKERAGIIVDDALRLLLTGLPQGLLSAVVWLIYSAWTALSMRL